MASEAERAESELAQPVQQLRAEASDQPGAFQRCRNLRQSLEGLHLVTVRLNTLGSGAVVQVGSDFVLRAGGKPRRAQDASYDDGVTPMRAKNSRRWIRPCLSSSLLW